MTRSVRRPGQRHVPAMQRKVDPKQKQKQTHKQTHKQKPSQQQQQKPKEDGHDQDEHDHQRRSRSAAPLSTASLARRKTSAPQPSAAAATVATTSTAPATAPSTAATNADSAAVAAAAADVTAAADVSAATATAADVSAFATAMGGDKEFMGELLRVAFLEWILRWYTRADRHELWIAYQHDWSVIPETDMPFTIARPFNLHVYIKSFRSSSNVFDARADVKKLRAKLLSSGSSGSASQSSSESSAPPRLLPHQSILDFCIATRRYLGLPVSNASRALLALDANAMSSENRSAADAGLPATSNKRPKRKRAVVVDGADAAAAPSTSTSSDDGVSSKATSTSDATTATKRARMTPSTASLQANKFAVLSGW